MMEKNKILILSTSKDPHALIVQEGIRRLGGDATLLCTADFPTILTQTIKGGPDSLFISLNGPGIDISDQYFDVIWNRRPTLAMPEGVLHPSDFSWAERSCRIFQQAMFGILGKNAFWVNKLFPERDKITQQSLAHQVGMETPCSLYSNDPSRIKLFIQESPNGVVYKPLVPGVWKSKENGNVFSAGTQSITLGDLVDDDILACSPGIYQHLVPKEFELRITAFGRHIVGAKIQSQHSEKARIDYRMAYDEIIIEEWEVPDELRRKVFDMMDKMDIRYGAFDFICKPSGEYVFLEVNESGQFLFLEEACGVPLLDPFCRFLMSGDPNFTYLPSDSKLSLSEITSQVARDYANFESMHVIPKASILLE